MSASTLVLIGCMVACPLGMGAMMWFMGKGMGRSHDRHASKSDEPNG